jgi:hypothetical protein
MRRAMYATLADELDRALVEDAYPARALARLAG